MDVANQLINFYFAIGGGQMKAAKRMYQTSFMEQFPRLREKMEESVKAEKFLVNLSEWFPKSVDMNPRLYAIQLKEQRLTLLELLFVLVNIDWIALRNSETTIQTLKDNMPSLQRMSSKWMVGRIEWKREKFRTDTGELFDIPYPPHPREAYGVTVQYDGANLLLLLTHFFVTQEQDIQPMYRELLMDFCNLAPALTRKGVNDEGGRLPPVVCPEDDKGLGLKAMRSYQKGQFISWYGGVIMSQDIYDSVKRPGTYTFSLYMSEEEEAQRFETGVYWNIDGKLFFRLSEKARFANEASDEPNAVIDFVKDRYKQVPREPYNRKCYLVATRQIEEGEFIHIDYGNAYFRDYEK